MARDVVCGRDRRRGGIADGQQHIPCRRAAVDVPSVVAGERCGISTDQRRVLVYRAHVVTGVVVPVDSVIAVVDEIVGAQVAGRRDDAVMR